MEMRTDGLYLTDVLSKDSLGRIRLDVLAVTDDDPEDVFTDPTAYPATEKDISDFSAWTAIKRPALQSRINRDMVDVSAVIDTGLQVIEDSEQTPLDQLVEGDDDQAEASLPVEQLRRR